MSHIDEYGESRYIKVRHELREKYVRIFLEGEFHLADVPVTADRILAFCEKAPNGHVLLDMLGMTGTMSLMERFTMASVFTAKYLKARMANEVPVCRFAALGK